jgi:hypothetical protein
VDQAGNLSDEAQVTVVQASMLQAGDINGDRAVDLKDALLAFRVINRKALPEGLSPYGEKGVDVNGDGKVGLAEAVYILKALSEAP